VVNAAIRTAHAGDAAVFLDRDGVIVVPEFRDGRSFAPTTLASFRLYPDAAAQLGRLKEAGYRLIVVSNQPDVGKGIIASDVLDAMNEKLLAALPLDLIKICTHAQAETCACRKPKPGMLLAAADEIGVDFSRSFIIGDRASDIEAGAAAGCATVFIDLGYTEAPPMNANFTVRSLAEGVDAILNHSHP
jgi:D-glycero-D-manno-heptose 1,7-bisphosphate phosphatase